MSFNNLITSTTNVKVFTWWNMNIINNLCKKSKTKVLFVLKFQKIEGNCTYLK